MAPSLTRRRLLVTGAATAGALAAAGCGSSRSGRKRKVDVAVVGAGLSGLIAARRLAAAGRSIVVLEARDRVGGRIQNGSIGGGKIVELGGEFVGPGQARVLGLLKRLGLKTFDTYYAQGKSTLEFRGKRSKYTGLLPPLPATDVAELGLKLTLLDEMAKKVPLGAPWDAPQAEEWDSINVETWNDQNSVTAGARLFVGLATGGPFGCEPWDVSLLHFLFLVHSAGGMSRLLNVRGGGQQSRVVGGTQLIVDRVATPLKDSIVLESPVLKLDQTGRKVVVTTADGDYEAGRAIVAVPPTLAARILYDPPLPVGRDQFTQRAPMGAAIKAQAVYPTPFWRSAGLNGFVTSDVGPIHLVIDNSPPDGKPGVLLGFFEGDAAREWGPKPAGERRAAALEAFTRFFGSQAATPVKYVERDWAREEWSRGGTTAFLPPGVLTEYRSAWFDPVDRIHWAGTETATDHYGYMDGAVSAGERAARAVLTA